MIRVIVAWPGLLLPLLLYLSLSPPPPFSLLYVGFLRIPSGMLSEVGDKFCPMSTMLLL